jgi:hypothetical protein
MSSVKLRKVKTIDFIPPYVYFALATIYFLIMGDKNSFIFIILIPELIK